MPAELDVPHWATAMVSNYREQLQLPERVTDRMIFARLQQTSGMDQEDEARLVAHLIKETEGT